MAYDDFAQAYALAREARADARADRIDEYIDGVKSGKLDAHSARVMIDAERWQAGKEQPRKYSDRVEVTGAGGAPLGQVSASSAIEALIASLPDLATGRAHTAPQQLLPSSAAVGDGAGEAAGARSSDPAASSEPDEVTTAPLANAEDLDLSDDPDGDETPRVAA